MPPNSTLPNSPAQSIPDEAVRLIRQTYDGHARPDEIIQALNIAESINRDVVELLVSRLSDLPPGEAAMVVIAVYAQYPMFSGEDGLRGVRLGDLALHESIREEIWTGGIPSNDLRRLPYQDYLQTRHWQYVRDRALDRADHKCQLCGSPHKLQVHHNSYEHRGDERDRDLLVLCGDCHQHFHDRMKVRR